MNELHGILNIPPTIGTNLTISLSFESDHGGLNFPPKHITSLVLRTILLEKDVIRIRKYESRDSGKRRVTGNDEARVGICRSHGKKGNSLQATVALHYAVQNVEVDVLETADDGNPVTKLDRPMPIP